MAGDQTGKAGTEMILLTTTLNLVAEWRFR